MKKVKQAKQSVAANKLVANSKVVLLQGALEHILSSWGSSEPNSAAVARKTLEAVKRAQ